MTDRQSQPEPWTEGDNIDLYANKLRLETAKTAMGMADAITTTTPILADVYREFNKNVIVLPNCIDTHIWQPADMVKSDEVRLFWSGGDHIIHFLTAD